jgi:hypothetical protein
MAAGIALNPREEVRGNAGKFHRPASTDKSIRGLHNSRIGIMNGLFINTPKFKYYAVITVNNGLNSGGLIVA